jgi:hypothetical protein
VSNKQRRINSQASAKEAEQIQTTNRFEPLSEPPCINSQNGTPTNLKTQDTSKREPKPPPIYIYSVNNLQALLHNQALVTENDTYIVKVLSNKTMKIMSNMPEKYRRLIQHVRDEKNLHHTYQIKQEKGCRIVICDLHHSIPMSDIIKELNKKGRKVRNMINVKHRIT